MHSSLPTGLLEVLEHVIIARQLQEVTLEGLEAVAVAIREVMEETEVL